MARPEICARLLALGTVASLAACGDDPPPVVVSQGRVSAAVYPEPPAIVVSVDGEVVWQTGRGAQAGADGGPSGFGAVGAGVATVQMIAGSFRFGDETDTWQAIDALADVVAGADGVTFTLRADGVDVGTGSLDWVAATRSGPDPDAAGFPRHLRIQLDGGPARNRMALASPCTPDEHLVGLGGQSWALDHRGQRVPLWVQEDGIGKPDVPDDNYEGIWFLSGRRHSTHTPMPMLLSTRGVATAVATDARAVFSLCSDDDQVTRYEVWDHALDLQVFVGAGADGPARTRDALGHMLAWTGKPARPPRVTFAPWLDAIYGEANVRRVATRLRDEGIAVGAIWTEDFRGGRDEVTGYSLDEDWRVDRVLYPGFEQLADDLHGLGYKFLTYYNSFVDSQADVYPEATAAGHVVMRADGSPYLFLGVKFADSALLDLDNPAAVSWAQGLMREHMGQGADGWMADFAEWQPHDARLASGADPMLAHNRYPVEWARLNRDALAAQGDGVDRLFFVRSAWLGSQPLAPIVWMGDQQTDFSAGDGQASVIPMMLGLGLTGFPYVGHDVAGYMSQNTVPTDRELWFRWVTLGALSPVMRTHHGRSARDNYQWEADATSIAHLRTWSRLHMQLVPYQWGLAGAVERDGLPLVRPLGLEHPRAPGAWTTIDQFLLGDRLLVAPVLERGATSRTVALGAGRWFPLRGPALAHDGGADGAEVRVDAGLESIPALVPEGTLLVLWPDGVDSTEPAPARPAARTGDEVGADRDVWLWPGQPAGDVGRWNDEAGPAGAASWSWSGRGPAAAPAGATWNGAAVPLVPGPDEVAATVTGDGVLEFAGGGSLTISRGAPGATVTVRLRVGP
ncbi:MAG: hypothetical protein KA297_07610 [Kofleriaceae bacterium]|nr:hypothetical protein [Kofleriaceae bacterium]